MTAERSFLDTNVLVYAFDDAEREKQAQARLLLADHPPGELVVSTQVLIEFYSVATRKLSLAEETAAALVDRWAKLQLVTTDADLVRAAIVTSRASMISLFDALIIEAARVGGCTRVLTEDLAGGSVISGVRVENPFA